MWRISSMVRLIDAGLRVRGVLRRPDDPRLPQVGNEVFDISRSPDFRKWSVGKVVDDRLQPVIDCLANREGLREDVPLLVDIRELPERDGARFAWRLNAPLVVPRDRTVASRIRLLSVGTRSGRTALYRGRSVPVARGGFVECGFKSGGTQPAVPAALACGGVSALCDAHLRREASA